MVRNDCQLIAWKIAREMNKKKILKISVASKKWENKLTQAFQQDLEEPNFFFKKW
jgi:hypothetical protein